MYFLFSRIISVVHVLFVSVVDRHCFDADPSFHFFSDRNPDHTPYGVLFKYVGKSGFFLLFKSLPVYFVLFLVSVISILEFSGKSTI